MIIGVFHKCSDTLQGLRDNRSCDKSISVWVFGEADTGESGSGRQKLMIWKKCSMGRKTLTALVAVLFIVFLAGQILGIAIAGMERTVRREVQDTSFMPCEDGYGSEHSRQFERDTQLQITVSTSDCPVEVEILDQRNRFLKMSGEAYDSLNSFEVSVDGSKQVSVVEASGLYFVDVSVKVFPTPSTTVRVIWTYVFTEPDPVGVYLASRLILLSGVSVFFGLLFLVSTTRLPELGAILAALLAIIFAVSPYAFSSMAVSFGFLGAFTFVGISSLMMGLSSYLLTQRLLGSRTLSLRIAVSLAGYLIAGTVTISLTALWARFSGVPLILVPFWPLGVAFVLFSERVYDPSPLITLVWTSAVLVVVIGVGAILLSYWRGDVVRRLDPHPK